MPFLKKEKVFLGIKILFPIVLLLIVTFELQDLLASIDVDLLVGYIQNLNVLHILFIVLGGLLALSPMYLYDFLLVKFLHLEIPKRQLIQYSHITNSFSNLLGFGGLIGVALRTYFYQNYEPDKRKLLKGIAAISLFYLSGISFLAWFVNIGDLMAAIPKSHKWIVYALWIITLYLAIILFGFFMKKSKLHSLIKEKKSAVYLFLVSFLEWGFIYLYLYSLTAMLQIPVSASHLFQIFVLAACAGIISMIPGGIGSFDLVFLWGFYFIGIPDEKVVILLLLYRVGYFILPFIIGVFLLFKQYWKKWNQSWSNLPNLIVQNVSHVFLTVLVFLSGLVLLVSAALPGILKRLTFMQEIFSFEFMNLSHHISVGTGFALLGLSRGIEYKEKRAYHLTLFVLIFAAFATFFKGMDYEEATFLLVVAFVLRLSKERFYRENFVMTWGKALFDITITLFITFLYILIGYLSLGSSKLDVPDILLPYIIVDARELFFSAIMGIIIAILFIVFGYVIRKPKTLVSKYSTDQEAEIKQLLETYKGTTLSHLIFMHDKFVFWNKNKNVLFSYQIYADKIIILGDPIGERKEFFKAIEEFHVTADRFGYTPVFYQVSKEMIPYLHGNGYDFFKLGEEAHVRLEDFTLSGKRMKSLRALRNKFEREGFVFTVLYPPYSEEVFAEMSYISNEWLQGRKEKGFSLGFYDENYLNKGPIALVRNVEGEMIAFTSLMPVYDDQTMISVDLMRSLPNAPSGTMDYIFLCLFDWTKSEGYKWFNMGMAPLSNVGQSKFSFLSEKIAGQIYVHGHTFYQFQGLRRFKEKYAEEWEPKYLAYRKKSSLPVTMMQVTMLVSKKRS